MKKNPLYALLIAPIDEQREAILAGRKKITIREGHRDYRLGPVMLVCHLRPWAVAAEITDIKLKTLGEVTQEEWEADGFATKADLLSGLRKFYPNILLESPMTVIRWENVHGLLKDIYGFEQKFMGA